MKNPDLDTLIVLLSLFHTAHLSEEGSEVAGFHLGKVRSVWI